MAQLQRSEALIRSDAVLDKLAEVQAYRGTELYAAFVHLLGLIDDSYRDDLIDVSPENLRLKQGGAKQCRKLREALIDGTDTVVPKV